MTTRREKALLLFRKGEEDLVLLEEVVNSARVGNAIIGFHAQQAAEKMLKALLLSGGIAYPYTHDLKLLVSLLIGGGQPSPPGAAKPESLVPFAALLRYEDLPQQILLDRSAVLALLHELHEYVKSQIG